MSIHPDSAGLEPLFASSGYEFILLNKSDAVAKGRPVGKAPLERKWRTTPSLTPEQCRELMDDEHHNIGVRLRPTDIILDVDPRNFEDGTDSLAALTEAFGLDLSGVPHVKTGGGGHHFYFRKAADVRTLETIEGYPGIEFKSVGRQVVAPGSIHPETLDTYTVAEDSAAFDTVPELPSAILDVLVRPAARPNDGGGDVTPEQLEMLLSHLDVSRYDDQERWQQMMMACHHMTGGDGAAEFDLWSFGGGGRHKGDVLTRWDSLDGKKAGNIASGTFWKFAEEDLGKVACIQLRGALRKMQAGPELDLLVSIAAEELDDPDSDFWAEPKHEPEVQAKKTKKGGKVLDSEGRVLSNQGFLTVHGLRQRPAPQFLIPHFIKKGKTGMLFARWGQYKTYWAVSLLCWAGLNLERAGMRPTDQCRVIVLAAEGDDDYLPRIDAFLVGTGLRAEDMDLHLQDWPVRIDTEQEFAAVKKRILGLGPSEHKHTLIVYDTFTKSTALDMNAPEIGNFLTQAQRLNKEIGGATSLMLAHTSAKAGNRQKTISGHSNIENNSDFLLYPETTGRKSTLRIHKMKSGPDRFTLEAEFRDCTLPDGTEELAVVPVKVGEVRMQPKKAEPKTESEIEAEQVSKAQAKKAEAECPPDFGDTVIDEISQEVIERLHRRFTAKKPTETSITLSALAKEVGGLMTKRHGSRYPVGPKKVLEILKANLSNPNVLLVPTGESKQNSPLYGPRKSAEE